MTTVAHRTPTVLENVPFVDTPTNPPRPLPPPGRNPHTVSMVGACTGLGVGLAGLVWAALHQHGYIFWPIGVVLLMAAVTAVYVLRHAWWDADNARVCEFVTAHDTV